MTDGRISASPIFSDIYFARAREIAAKYHPDKEVLMQFFCKKDAILCGMREVKKILSPLTRVDIDVLEDGTPIEPWETVMTIRGRYADFGHLETILLGILARQTRVATNVLNVCKAARFKDVYFFPARFDYYSVQESDGYAARIGGASAVSTPSQSLGYGALPKGTIPHALIALFDGDTAAATVAFAREYPNEKCISLVDFHNNCPATALDVAQRMRAEGLDLYGVRLDTSENLVDESLINDMGSFRPNGVCKELVWKTRNILDINGFSGVKIFVSGGFTVDKIRDFELSHTPVDGYGVGSSMLDNKIDFTADIVMVKCDGKWVPRGKVGRIYRKNPRLRPL